MWRMVLTLVFAAFGAAGMAFALGDLLVGAGVGAAMGAALGLAVSSFPNLDNEIPLDVDGDDDNGDGESGNTPTPLQM